MHDALKKGFSAQSRPPICARYPPHSCTSSSESSQGTSFDVPHPTSDDMRASRPTCGPPCAAGAHLVLVNFTFRARISSSLPPKARRYRGLVVRWGPAAAPDATRHHFPGQDPPSAPFCTPSQPDRLLHLRCVCQDKGLNLLNSYGSPDPDPPRNRPRIICFETTPDRYCSSMRHSKILLGSRKVHASTLP